MPFYLARQYFDHVILSDITGITDPYKLDHLEDYLDEFSPEYWILMGAVKAVQEYISELESEREYNERKKREEKEAKNKK